MFKSIIYCEIMKVKGLGGQVKDVSGRTIVAYVSAFGNIDKDGDLMTQGCYKKSLMERGKNGSNMLRHLSNHRPYPEFVLSIPDFEEDAYGLKMTSTIIDTNHGNDIAKLYQEGLITEHSVMFTVPRGKWETKQLEDGTEYTTIFEAKLYEGSTVVWGANPETPTLEVKSLFENLFENDVKKAFEHSQKLVKAIRKGTYTDDMFPLLEMQLKMTETFIEEEIERLKDIQVVPTPEPLIIEPSKNDVMINFLKELKYEL